MERRKFSREFKLEAVRLVKEPGVAVAQAALGLDLHENLLRKWVRELSADPQQAFPGHGQLKPGQLEIEKLRREVAKLKAERDILKKAAAPTSAPLPQPRDRGANASAWSRHLRPVDVSTDRFGGTKADLRPIFAGDKHGFLGFLILKAA